MDVWTIIFQILREYVSLSSLCWFFFKQTCRQKQITARKLLRVNTEQTAYLQMRTHRWCERPILHLANTDSVNISTIAISYLVFFLMFLSAEGVLLVTNIIFFLMENLEESPISTKGFIPYISLYVFVVVFSCESL